MESTLYAEALKSPVLVALVGGFASLLTAASMAALNYYLGQLKARKAKLTAITSEANRIEIERHRMALNFTNVGQRIVKIDNILTVLRSKLNAHRVTLFQFHNGGNFFSGESMLRVTATNEACAAGAESLSKEFQNLLIGSSMFHYINSIYLNEYLHFPDISVIADEEIRNLKLYYGGQECFDHIIKDDYGLPIACLCVTMATTAALVETDIHAINVQAAGLQRVLLAARNKISTTRAQMDTKRIEKQLMA